MSDAGLFGPSSVAWRIHEDPCSIVGGMRSLMVQALQPRAMAGVAQHSDFRVDFWGRLRRTSDYLFTVIYGTTEEAEAQSAVVRAVHARITGVDDFTGLPYRADEPELLAWVANATVESYLTSFRIYGRGRLHQSDADQYVKEMRELGRLMGLPRESLPSDEHALRQYFDEQESLLAASPAAKQALRGLLNPQLPLKLRPLWGVPAAAALTSLPDSYRRMFGLPWTAPVQPGVRASTAAMLMGLRLLLPPHPVVAAAKARATRAA